MAVQILGQQEKGEQEVTFFHAAKLKRLKRRIQVWGFKSWNSKFGFGSLATNPRGFRSTFTVVTVMPHLPLFPLNLVAFPGEKLNLHIFEPRYRQLIGECLDLKSTFGIPAYVNNSLPGYGTEMHVMELVTQYEDGRMDIRTRGLRVFRLLDFENPAPGKLYAHGDVHFYPKPDKSPPILPQLIDLVEKLYKLFKTELPFQEDSPQPYSYQIAHGVGLPLEGEYELLTLESELERQEFLRDHLEDVLPVVENMERTKERIRMNGDFREFGSPKL